jgi:excinuclease UvrABC ATPase subunit
MLTQERLKELLHYDEETGVFTWLNSPRNNVPSGSIAGTIDKKGYVRILYSKKLYLAHRLAWLYVHGNFPKNDIDHINGNPTDNRICNLRPVTRKQNMENKKIYKTNKSGYSGVTWHSRDKKWNVRIGHYGKRISLGYFDNLNDAIAVRIKAENNTYTHNERIKLVQKALCLYDESDHSSQ